MARYRITGGSGPFGGAQWERKDDDREIARRVLNLLADRGMLWRDCTLEIEEHCVRSADTPAKNSRSTSTIRRSDPRCHGASNFSSGCSGTS
jgi:hypothetical protein